MRKFLSVIILTLHLSIQIGNAQNKVVLTNSKQTATITVKDSSKYSWRYLQSLLQSGDGDVFIIEDSIIKSVYSLDTLGIFPCDYLPLNKQKILAASKENKF